MDSDIPSFNLIDICIANPSIRETLKEIKAFQQQTISRLYNDHINTLVECGYEFQTTSISGRKQELKLFILTHPEVMSNDIETLLCNIAHYVSRSTATEKAYQEKQARQMHERIINASRKKPLSPEYEMPPAKPKPRKIKKIIYEDDDEELAE